MRQLIVKEKRQEVRKIAEKEIWSKQQPAVSKNSWKHLYKEIETFKQPSAFLKVKELFDKHGQPKTDMQIKNKLRNLKNFYSTIDNPS